MVPKEPRENILERIKERQAARRKKVIGRSIKVACALGVIAIVLAILYPYLQVTWYVSKAGGTDPEARKEALQWLADHDVKSSIGVFVEALKSGWTESDIAFKAIRKFNDPSIVEDLLGIWKDKNVKPHGRYNALQLVAELGEGSLINEFINPLAILSDKGWMSSYDFLNKHADRETVEKLLEMLDSQDTRQQRAAATALRYIRKKSLVGDDSSVKNALASKLSSPEVKVREDAAQALIEIADEEQLPWVMNALDDESPAVCRYAAMTIGYMDPEVTKKAIPKLLEKLLHPDGRICTEAAFTLRKIVDASALPRLVEIVNDRDLDSFSRENAIEVLKSIPDPRAIEAITNVLTDPEINVAMTAARALIRAGGTGSVGPLVKTLNTAKSEKLRIVAAYALGMLAQKEAAPALLEAMKKGDPDLAKIAGEALLKIGAREYDSELAMIIRDEKAFPVSRREALIVLSQFRTPLSLEMAIDLLIDRLEGIREEAGNAAQLLSADLLAETKQDLDAARSLLLEAAGFMLQKKLGKELGEELAGAVSFDDMNQSVFSAMRHLDEKNTHDLDLLERYMDKAKNIYWTSLMREDFVKSKVSREQLAQAAGALREYIVSAFIAIEPPTGGHREMGAELRKKFGFNKTQQNE